MKQTYTYILLFITFAAVGKTLNAQEGMYPYVDMYSSETLKGKGVLYAQPQQQWPELTAYNERFEVESKLPSTYIKAITDNLLILQVCEQKDEYFRLTPYAENANKLVKQPISVWVSKQEMNALGFHYMSLETLAAFCKAKPTMVRNMLGAEVQPQTLAPQVIAIKPARYQDLILREKPDDSAPFISIETPCGMGDGKTTVLSKSGDWFQLQLYIRCIYNGSSDLNVCARSLFEATYEGYWKAPCDENGFPFLLVEMLGTGSGCAWPAVIDFAKR